MKPQIVLSILLLLCTRSFSQISPVAFVQLASKPEVKFEKELIIGVRERPERNNVDRPYNRNDSPDNAKPSQPLSPQPPPQRNSASDYQKIDNLESKVATTTSLTAIINMRFRLRAKEQIKYGLN